MFYKAKKFDMLVKRLEVLCADKDIEPNLEEIKNTIYAIEHLLGSCTIRTEQQVIDWIDYILDIKQQTFKTLLKSHFYGYRAEYINPIKEKLAELIALYKTINVLGLAQRPAAAA
jgi:hypothetical protein